MKDVSLKQKQMKINFFFVLSELEVFINMTYISDCDVCVLK